MTPKDYNDCKYDRGHMAPAADFAHNDAQYKSTFTMANISPQAPFLNRGIWERLESWIRHYLLQFHFEVRGCLSTLHLSSESHPLLGIHARRKLSWSRDQSLHRCS